MVRCRALSCVVVRIFLLRGEPRSVLPGAEVMVDGGYLSGGGMHDLVISHAYKAYHEEGTQRVSALYVFKFR